MEKKFLKEKIEKGMTFKQKYDVFKFNLWNTLLCRLYTYEIDSLKEFYENKEDIHGYCHMTNLEYIGKKQPAYLERKPVKPSEIIIELKDHSYSLEFKILREYYTANNDPEWLSMDEDDWKTLESLQKGDRINVVFGVGYRIPYLIRIKKINDENKKRINIPDYPSQLLEKVIR